MIKLAAALLFALLPTPAQAPVRSEPINPALYLTAEAAIITQMAEWHVRYPYTPKVYFYNVISDMQRMNVDPIGSPEFNTDVENLEGDFTSLAFYIDQHKDSETI